MHVSFEEAYEEFKIFAAKRQKKQSFDTLHYNFNLRILPYFKGKKLIDLTSNDFLIWEQEILKENFSNNYNRNLYYHLSCFISFCETEYNFDKNILSKVGCFKRKYEEKHSDFYNINEFKRFIKNVDDNIYKQFFNLMFFTGTRPGEAMALHFSDLQGDYIVIDKTIASHGNREIGTPKTFSSNRKIKIDRVLKRDLLELKKFYELKYGAQKDYFIFGGLKPLAPSTINRRKLKACEKANLRPITLHQFRHSHATLLLQNGMLINEVSRRLGHSKVSTTLDVYTHTDLLQEKKVQDKLNFLRNNFFDTLHYNFKKLISILNHISMF